MKGLFLIFITVCSSLMFEKLTKYESMYPGDTLGDFHFYQDKYRCVLESNLKPFKTWDNYDGNCRITLTNSKLLLEYSVKSFLFGHYYTYGRFVDGSVLRENRFIGTDFVNNTEPGCLSFVNYDHGILLRYYS